MFVAFSSCIFHPDTTSPEALAAGDGELFINASALGLAPGVPPPEWVEIERAPGVVVQFERLGKSYLVDSEADTEEFVGWSYFEDEATDVPGVTPCVNFMVLNG